MSRFCNKVRTIEYIILSSDLATKCFLMFPISKKSLIMRVDKEM